MAFLVLLLSVSSFAVIGRCAYVQDENGPSANAPGSSIGLTDSSSNLTDPSKDMYVIHATVYQVGILTNRTDNMTDHINSTGNQESVTLYHTNGGNVDLSAIPEPFLTNVTAQTMVGVAPVTGAASLGDALDQLTHSTVNEKSTEGMQKRSVDYSDIILRLLKREATGDGSTAPVKVVHGAALIPPQAGVQSISLPPLLAFNNNLTEIPVPIPNTSVVHYAKVNTLIQKP